MPQTVLTQNESLCFSIHHLAGEDGRHYTICDVTLDLSIAIIKARWGSIQKQSLSQKLLQTRLELQRAMRV